ncbi:single-stranded DNA-binding protein, partial [Fulvivirga sp. 29W222]|nr:single-stranded DNA-binding protein [Fulvivirga marina]
MKNLRNSVNLIGRLGQDPILKDLNNGKTVATFSVATSESYYNVQGEKIEDTQWHHVVAWGKPGEIAAQYLKKGQEVAIEGKLIHRSYETGSGERKYITEINLNSILMLVVISVGLCQSFRCYY